MGNRESKNNIFIIKIKSFLKNMCNTKKNTFKRNQREYLKGTLFEKNRILHLQFLTSIYKTNMKVLSLCLLQFNM